MLSFLPLLIVALIVLSILVLVHEFGHFVAARLSGVWVEEFGIGLPPRVWGKKIGKTIYSVNALPIGGFVRLHGEASDEKVTKPDEAFVNKSKLARIFVAVAGVAMNFVLAIIFFAIIANYTGIARGVLVLEVSPDSPASAAGIVEKDKILKIADKEIGYTEDFQTIIAGLKGREVTIQVEHEVKGKVIQENKTAVIRGENSSEGLLGVVFSPSELYYPPVWQRPIVLGMYGVTKTIKVSGEIVDGLVSLVGQLSGGVVPKGVAGPVGVTAFIAEVAKLGILPLMEFSAVISINLALINLVPFPPLDGSRVVFVLLESIIGKRVLPRIESMMHTAGMIILLFLMLIVTAGEIPKLLTAGSLSKFVESLLQ